MKNTLILDMTPFYGGGQKFVSNIYKYSNHKDKYYFAVSNSKLFEDLRTNNKVFLENTNSPYTLKKVNKYIIKHKINTVILNGNRPIYFAPFISVKQKIAYRHTSNNAFKGIKRLIGYIALNISFLFCDKIIVLYKAALTELWQKSKGVVINNGISINELNIARGKSPNKKHIVVTCISRLDPDKGIEWLIDVFDEITSVLPNIVLKIAGNGVMKDLLELKIKNPSIKLLGFINNIEQLLSESDLFVLPSKYECFPLSILEAMNYSLPIIATKTGGVSEIVIDNENGFIVNFGDSIALKKAILFLLNNNHKRLMMGTNSFSKIKNFDISESVNKLEKLTDEN